MGKQCRAKREERPTVDQFRQCPLFDFCAHEMVKASDTASARPHLLEFHDEEVFVGRHSTLSSHSGEFFEARFQLVSLARELPCFIADPETKPENT